MQKFNKSLFGKKDKSLEKGDAWSVQDRITELKGKLALKERDKEAYYTFSQNSIKENETKIRKLRTEIKNKQIQLNKILNASEYIIRSGFQGHKESQLAMQRYTVDKCREQISERVFDKVGFLNMCKNKRDSSIKKIKELTLMLEELKCGASYNDEIKSGQRVRILTTRLDKMKMKSSSARFIQNTYKKILHHMERENLLLPKRLNELESSLMKIGNELRNELFKIHNCATDALQECKKEKESFESSVVKEKRKRDRTLATVRKRFKQINQEGGERDAVRSRAQRRKTMAKLDKVEVLGDEDSEKRGPGFWTKVQDFWTVKRQLDHLREQVCVTDLMDISVRFQVQAKRTEELKITIGDLTTKKGLRTSVLSTAQEEKESLAKDREILQQSTIKTVTEMERKCEESLDRIFQLNILQEKAEGLRQQLEIAIEHIRHKVASFQWADANEAPTGVVSHVAELKSMRTEDDSPMCLQLCSMVLQMVEASISKDIRTGYLNPVLVAKQGGEMADLFGKASNNTRIEINDDDDVFYTPTENILCDDDDHNDQYLSREGVKAFDVKKMIMGKKGRGKKR